MWGIAGGGPPDDVGRGAQPRRRGELRQPQHVLIEANRALLHQAGIRPGFIPGSYFNPSFLFCSSKETASASRFRRVSSFLASSIQRI